MWLGVVLGTMLIIITIIIIILVIYNFTSNDNITNTQGLNETCTSTTGCITGLICQKGICKAQINGFCNDICDCISGATACQDHVCISSALGWFGDNCSKNSDCQQDLVCYHSTCKGPIDGPCDDISDCVPQAARCVTDSNSITGKICLGPAGGFDQPCKLDDPNTCAAGLQCDPQVMVCKYMEGQDCHCSSDCISGLACIEGMCMQYQELGQYCHNHEHCIGDSKCQSSKVIDANNNDIIVDMLYKHCIDIVNYKDGKLLLLDNGKLNFKYKGQISSVQARIIDDNVIQNIISKINRISIFNNILYGLIGTKLYKCISDKITYINWQLVEGLPANIKHISHSLDHKILYIQYPQPKVHGKDLGVIYDINLNQVNEFTLNSRIIREYGLNKLSYIEYDTEHLVVTSYPKKQKITKVKRVTIDKNGQLHYILIDAANQHHNLIRDENGAVYSITQQYCQ